LRPAQALGDLRGRRILAVNGAPVDSLLDLREVLKQETRGVLENEAASAEGVTVTLRMERPAHPSPIEVEMLWRLDRAAVELLHDETRLGWTSPLLDTFAQEEITLKADSPAAAVAMGLRRTHRVMTMTYLTFVRLFQGSVKVEHLKGPVGIAHVGTVIADRGFVWLLFFMALISVNLAVINFLPIPIADGGHFVFLLYEQITGRPPPVAVQNAAAIAGLVLIASVFLIVTFNDIRNLF
jgi:regulator of sigma E protease